MKDNQNRKEQALDQAIVEEALAQEMETKLAREQRIARLRLLWEQRRILWKFVGIGLAIAAAVAFLIPKRYDSTARLMPPDDQSGTGMALMAALAGRTGSGSLGSLAGDLLGVHTTGDLFIGILKSRTMQDRLVNQFDLQKVYGVSGADKARQKLEERTEISSDRLSGIITLTVRDHDPKRAAAMGDAYIDGLNSLVATLSTSSARRERIFLEGRLNQVRQNLETAEVKFSQFASNNTAIDIPEEGKAVVTAAATLEGQLIAAESELDGLKQIYTDNNVRVRSISARVDELRQELQKMGGGKNADSGSQGEQPLFPSIRKLPILGVTYADLYRQTKVQEAVFEALTQEYELAKVEEAKEIPTVKVLDTPNIPERKAFPPRLLIVCSGMFLSLALGVVWVLGGEHWAQLDAQDPAKALGEEIFTTVRARLHLSQRNGSGTPLDAHAVTNASTERADAGRDKERPRMRL
jgi:uncharacterized protein involved in exopolysaccharide biosynthesis